MATKRSSTRKARESMIQVDIPTDESQSVKSQFSPNSSASSNSTLLSRQQEKQELSHLNDRLASYIEHVRNLETDNARLQVQIRDVEIVERKEKSDLTARYENKIAEIRKQLDFMTREHARMEIEKGKALANESDLKARAIGAEKKLKSAENDLKNALKNVQDLTARSNNAENAQAILERENEILLKERDTLQRQVDILQKQLEDEVVLRTELEHKLKTCKDDLEFARRNHNNQLDEFRRKRQVEMTSFSTEIEDRYKAQLKENLQSMRDDFDRRIAQNRAEMDELFKTKLSEAETNAGRNRTAAAEAREDAARYRYRINELEMSIADHEKQVSGLNTRIRDLEQLLRCQQEDSSLRLQQRDDRIAALEADAAKMLNEYQDLMDVKMQLVTELQAYRKLLEGEESRLHITPTASPNISQSQVSFDESANGQRRGVKRKRFSDGDHYLDFSQTGKNYKVDSDSFCDVVIDRVDPEGQCISLMNKGEEDFPLGAHSIKSTAGDMEVLFKFHSRVILKPGKTVTVWSNDVGREQTPPTDYVMKNQKWRTGDAIRVEFFAPDGNVLAWYECIYEGGFNRFEQGNDPDERCSIM